MTHRISEIKGLDARARTAMRAAGIHTVEQLLDESATPAHRAALAKKLDVEGSELTEWINRADLMRLRGVGTEFSNLLEDGGVDSCKELQHRVPANLHAKLNQINEEKQITRRTPSLNEIEAWVTQAKTIAASS